MTKRPPNILLIVADCARSDVWHGPRRAVRTPNIDRLAAGGFSLPTTIAEKSCTTPCFTSLLTGLFSPRHGVHLVWGYRLSDRIPLLTHTLAAAGYHTYAEFTGPLQPDTGLDRAFERYEYRAPCDYLHTAWGAQFVERLRTGHYRGPWLIVLHLWELHEHRWVAPHHDTPESGRTTYERSVTSLDEQLAPILAAVGDDTIVAFTGDHGEKTPLETYREGTAVTFARDLLGISESDGMAPYQLAQWAGPSVLHEFYGRCTDGMRDVDLRAWRGATRRGWWTNTRDRLRMFWLTPFVLIHDLLALGRPLKLTAMLKRRGLIDPDRARRKVDQFARRHGSETLLDMHMRMWVNSYRNNLREGHMVHVYDFLVRVPLVLHAPGRLPAGSQSRRMVRQTDILPTLLELVGVPLPDAAARGGVALEGQSVLPLIRSGGAAESGAPIAGWKPAPAFLSVSGCPRSIELRGVRTEEWKYTYGPHNPDLPAELYDLQTDPGELNNLAATDPQRSTEMRQLADVIATRGGVAAPEAMAFNPAEAREVEERLRQLGYVE